MVYVGKIFYIHEMPPIFSPELEMWWREGLEQSFINHYMVKKIPWGQLIKIDWNGNKEKNETVKSKRLIAGTTQLFFLL